VWPPLTERSGPRQAQIPRRFADKVVEDRHALSECRCSNLDIWGEDIERQPAGIPKAVMPGWHPATPTERGFPADARVALMRRQPCSAIWMFHEDGALNGGDPRVMPLRAVG